MNGSPFDAARKKHWRTLGPTVAANLAAKGFEAVYADSREEALAEVLKLIPAGASVGVPGSVTIREIGAMDALSERGCSVIHHWDPSLSPEESPRFSLHTTGIPSGQITSIRSSTFP